MKCANQEIYGKNLDKKLRRETQKRNNNLRNEKCNNTAGKGYYRNKKHKVGTTRLKGWWDKEVVGAINSRKCENRRHIN